MSLDFAAILTASSALVGLAASEFDQNVLSKPTCHSATPSGMAIRFT
jgi:hypothetical protein